MHRSFLAFFLIFQVFVSPLYAEEAVDTKKATALSEINSFLDETLFFDVSFGAFNLPKVDRAGKPVLDDNGQPEIKEVKVPFVIVVLLGGGVFFTFFFGFINVRAFAHSIAVIRGKFDKDHDDGEISHFRALTSALSATIGLGNIAGVAIAIQIGGPGAAVWMIVTAFFGMSSKFVSCTLSQIYRQVNPDGSISGGPMYYLDLGLKDSGRLLALFGKVIAVLYAVIVGVAAFGAGGMFQVNQAIESLESSFGISPDLDWLLGLIIAGSVGVVILGGIKKIAYATSRIVPIMFVIYMLAGSFVVLSSLDNLIPSIVLMFKMAFSGEAVFGGFIGVLVMGIQRGSFSNEAGVGSAAIVHSAAKTNEPVREGIVAMIGPFIDTIIVCTMTALVVIVTGTWDNPDIVAQGSNIGVSITSAAFATVIPWFPYVLTLCILLFAYSTMIAWCYYGERGWIYVVNHFGSPAAALGQKTVILYRIAFLIALVIGAISSLEDVINFTDYVFLGLAIPNIFGCLFLVKKIKPLKDQYLQQYCS